MSVALYRNIVQHLTEEKLEELKHQKNSLSRHFLPVLQQAQDFSKNQSPLQILESLFKALNTSPISNIFSNDLLQSIEHLLLNAQDDPALSSSLILDWIASVTTEIRQALRKCEHSFVFASVLNEWLEHEERQQQQTQTSPEVIATAPQSESKLEAIEKVKKIMLSNPPEPFDSDGFAGFLFQNIFKREKVEEEGILSGIVKSTKTFFTGESSVSRMDVVNCLNGLKALKSLAPNKLGVLNDLKANHMAQQEIADLLSNRLANIDTWTWPKNVSTQVVDFRRGHTGEYKPFLNEDIITALFLQVIGLRWAMHFKQQLECIFFSSIWKRISTASFNSVENIREGFHKDVFLMALSASVSVDSNINVNDDYVKIETTAPIGTSAMPHSSTMSLFGQPAQNHAFSFSTTTTASTQGPTTSGGFGAAQNSGGFFGASISTPTVFGPTPKTSTFGAQVPNFDYQDGAMIQPGSSFAFGIPPPTTTTSFSFPSAFNQHPQPQFSKIDKKQSFLHMLNVEMKLSQVISHPDLPLIVVQAEIEDFESSVLHESLLVILQSFGVSSKWIEFFTKFMKMEISFPGKEKRHEKILRGLPTAHTLSTVFGEVLMFIFEFLINQHCEGLRVFRFQTELWFWNNDKDKMIKGWEILNRFGKMVGLKIKDTRSGSISILADDKIFTDLAIYGPVPLPQAGIHWGYLALGSKGIFQMDQNSISKFVQDMKQLLEKSTCVLEWINIFNKYMAFFVKNFGKTANVSGKQHLDQIVEAVKSIYSQLFDTVGGSPVDAMRHRFEILRENDVIDAVVYWPLKLGGLGLINPLIPVLSLKSSVMGSENPFKGLLSADKKEWEEKKKCHEKQRAELAKMRSFAISTTTTINIGYVPVQVVISPQTPSPFPLPEMETFEEFVSKRETQFLHWYSAYLKMLEIPKAKKFPASARLTELQRFYGFQGLKGVDDTYLAGLGNFYEAQLVKHFGTLSFINDKLLPISMIEKILDTDVKFN